MQQQRSDEDFDAEAFAHGALRLAGDHPGRFGRLRVARILAGYAVPDCPDRDMVTAQYEVSAGVKLPPVVALIDALLDGGLLTRTLGQKPVLCLTMAGWRALDALNDAVSQSRQGMIADDTYRGPDGVLGNDYPDVPDHAGPVAP